MLLFGAIIVVTGVLVLVGWMVITITLQNRELTAKVEDASIKVGKVIGTLRTERNSPLVQDDTRMVLDHVLAQLEKDN